MSGPASSDLTPCADLNLANQSESFALPEALKQFVVVVPSKIRLVCLAAFILDKCKVISTDGGAGGWCHRFT